MASSPVLAALRDQQLETPSWGYADSRRGFKVFGQPGAACTPYERINDAAVVGRFTGVASSVALHIPGDRVDDYGALARYAANQGLTIGSIHASTPQSDEYRLGGVASSDPRTRCQAIEHLLECIDVMGQTGARDLKLRFAGGTSYPGQDSIRDRQDLLAGALREIHARLGGHQRLLLGYDPPESAFYHTDVPDWGTAYAHCLQLGPRAQVVIDTGHHTPGTNIEFIVAVLLRAGKLGGLQFNTHFRPDDDLMAGAADPFQLFRTMHEIVRGDALRPSAGITFMLDQCRDVEEKIPAVIRSVMNVQEATAKALLVDADALSAARRAGEVLGANAVLMDAYNADVRPLLRQLREDMGLDPDPIAAYERSGHPQKARAERADRHPAGRTA